MRTGGERVLRTILNDVRGLIVYDLRDGVVLHEVTDYAMALSDICQMSMLTVQQEAGNVISFWEYLAATGTSLQKVADSTLIDFREKQLKGVLSRRNSFGSPRTARATVNQKLRSIYRWLLWLKEQGRVQGPAIGASGCRVTCEATTWRGGRRSHGGWSAVSYPLLFKQTGASSRHRMGFVPSRQTVDDVAAQLMDANQEPYIRLRNALFVDIAATVGLRRGSINSLTIDQFVRRELQAVDAPTVRIRPASQKFGYENDFEFPVWLALQVCDFVEGARADLVERVHKGVSVTRNRVFLSSRAAKPMTDRAMSQVVSRAMRAIGAPKGSAVHVLRSYYANEQIELEIDHRLARGLDTGTAAISAAVSLRLGHRNPHSLFAYVARAQSRRGLSDAARMRSEIVDLKTQVAQLREERARLLEQLVNKR